MADRKKGEPPREMLNVGELNLRNGYFLRLGLFRSRQTWGSQVRERWFWNLEKLRRTPSKLDEGVETVTFQGKLTMEVEEITAVVLWLLETVHPRWTGLTLEETREQVGQASK